jgi:methylmalonyl-CoA/ethylmalonyl-CoA epimerase
MSAYKIDHIGVAVVSIEGALPVYRALGLEESRREEVPAQKVVTAFLPAGESSIELLEPTSEDSPVARFLKKRGPGIHHICFAVQDIEAAVRDLAGKGFRLINERPAPGADGKKIVFLHPDAGHGVLIELSEDAELP